MSRARTLVWLLLLFVLPGVAQDPPEVLSNDSVLKMVKAGLPESLIVEMVRSHPGKYSLTSNRLIELKQAGVPAGVLLAMMNLTASGTQPSISPSSTPVSIQSRQTISSDREWVIRSVADKMTNQPRIEAETVFAVEGGAKVRATSSCALDAALARVNASPSQLSHVMQGVMNSADDHAPNVESQMSLGLDTRALYFRLQYLPKAGSGAALRATPVEQTVTPNAFGGGATISAPYSCVFMKVLVDGDGRGGVQSDLCSIPNTASIGFASVRAADIAAAVLKARGEKNDPLNRFVTGLTSTFAEASDQTIATMQQAMHAKEIDVQLPLTDGDSVLVRIEPQVPSFQQFVSKCLATFPEPKPARISPPGAGETENSAAHAPTSSRTLTLPHLTAPDATGHSLNDTYARTLEIMNDNASKGRRDAIGSTGWLTPFEVCYSVRQEVIDANHVRRVCDKTGEVVRVPGDLAVPPVFWDTYVQSCKAAGMGGLEVKLASPSPNDGKKRFISCTGVFLLGAERKQLIEKGLR